MVRLARRDFCTNWLLIWAMVITGISGSLTADEASEVWNTPEYQATQRELEKVWDLSAVDALKALDRYLAQPERYPGFHRDLRIQKLGLLLDDSGDAALAAQEAQKFTEQAVTAEDRQVFRAYRVTALSVLENWDEAIAEQQRLMEEYDPEPPRETKIDLASLLFKANQPQKSLELWESIRHEDGGAQNGTAQYDVVTGMVDALIALHRGEEALALLDQNPPADQQNELFNKAVRRVHLLTRVRVLESLGRTAEAAAETDAAEAIRTELADSRRIPPPGHHRDISRHIREMPKWWIVIPILALWGIFLYVARQQRRQEGGTWAAYFGITFGMACLCLLPWIVAVLLANWRDRVTENVFAISTVGVLFSAVYTSIFLKVPQLLVSGKATSTFPQLEDPEVLSTVTDLAAQLGIRPPRIRHVPGTVTLGGLHAQVGGLVAATVLIDLGVLHRLTVPERKAILAHELAHIRNHTIGVFACICPLAMSLALTVLPDPDQFFLFLTWAIALGLGLWKFVSRRFEYDCDYQAARLCGARELATALIKVHANSVIRNEGWASLLCFATQTHPSREQRLAALTEQFPDSIRIDGDWSADRRRLQTRINWVVGLIWLMILGVTASCREWPILGAVVCGLVILFPIFILQRAIRPEVKRQAERQRIRTSRLQSWLGFGVIMLFGATAAFVWIASQAPGILPRLDAMWAAVGIVPLGIVSIWAMRNSRKKSVIAEMNQKIQSALIEQNWQTAASFLDEKPEAVKADYAASHNTAIALWMLGREPEAIAELRRTWDQFPQQLQTGLTLWGLYSELEDWDSALAITDEFANRAPQDPLVKSLQASTLVRAGRLDEVRQLLSEEWSEEEQFSKLTVLARLRMEEQDWDAAKKLIEEADALAPGVLRLRLLNAELELARGRWSEARQLIDAAGKQLIDAPLELVQKRLARLQSRLVELSTSADESDPAAPDRAH